MKKNNGCTNQYDYDPKPDEFIEILLPSDLEDLIEPLAEYNHDIWAKSRFNEGWKYGKEKNGKKRTNPCLIPYDMLPEEEKEYDRRSAKYVLKMILKLGYKIEKN